MHSGENETRVGKLDKDAPRNGLPTQWQALVVLKYKTKTEHCDAILKHFKNRK